MRYSNPNGNGAKPFLTKLAEEKPENALEYALLYTSMSLAVVPSVNGQKRPSVGKWTELRLSPDQLFRHFNDQQNVGMLLGEPSSWLACVDQDAPEVPEISDRFLEPTLASGRKSTHRVHLYYRAPGTKTKRCQDTDGTMLLELLSFLLSSFPLAQLWCCSRLPWM